MTSRTPHRALALLPVVALALVATACAEKTGSTNTTGGKQIPVINAGKLTTCTHLPYEPFQFPQGGKIVGFDVDLVDLVAKDLGVTQNIVDTPFEGIQTGEDLNASKCDVAAAGMTITAVRKQNLDFSDPYFEATQAMLTKKGASYTTLDSLKGKKLGVQQATTGEAYATKNGPGVQLVQFEDLALELTAVKTGQVDAAINDNGVLFSYVKTNPDTTVSAEFNTGEQYGIGVKKGNDALRNEINDILKKAKQDGSYDSIYEKWFGTKPGQK